MQEQWTAVDEYLNDLFVPPDTALAAALAACTAAGLPPHSVSATQGKLLMLLAKLRQSRRILEIGTLGGYSTIWLARGLSAGGCLLTLESNSKHVEVARSNIASAGLSDVVEVRLGSALQSLEQLGAEGCKPFDLIFIDADKQSNPAYFAWSLKLSRCGTLIIADNIVRDGEVMDSASGDPSVQGVRRFNELLAAEQRVVATAIQTVGCKGYDGFAIALVTELADG